MRERLRLLDPTRPRAGITVVLATFHTTLLILVLLALGYFTVESSDLLQGLDTVVGLLLFGYFWVIAWVASGGALKQLGWPESVPIAQVARAACLWGGFTGAAVVAIPLGLASVFALVVGVALLDEIWLLRGPVMLGFGAITALVAFVVGALIGLVLGLIDTVLLIAARGLVRSATSAGAHGGAGSRGHYRGL